ncbi:MAG TPA: protein kinase [Blastocatellia bacterium]
MYCPECGAQLHPDDPYCGECGAKQESTAPPPLVVEAPKSRMREQKKMNGSSSVQLAPDTLLLDRYMIVKRVGGGGMGSVYLARDKRLADRPCAVKEMIELFADESQRVKAVDDFKREAEVLAQLEHPSIPTIYDYFIEGGRYYLVMKWIGGGDLAEQMRLRGGIVAEDSVCSWAIQICDVLNYIHSQKPPIIYRDLKPANLMLDDRTDRVMLVDFGIARIVRPTEKGVTAIGTMGYAPPELFAGKVEPRSDIYSLGATMFHMLTRADPQDNPLLIFDFNKNPRPSQLNPNISPGMEALLMSAVAHRPEDRPASALDFKHALEDHLARIRPDGRSQSGTHGSQGRVSVDAQSRPPVQSGGAAPSRSISLPGQQAAAEVALEWVYCGTCGQKIAKDDVYCPHCGTRQPAEVSPGRVTATLAVVGTNEMGRPFRIEKESVLIGRQDPHTRIFPEVDLTMHDPETKVSRKHARITRQGEHFVIEDLASVNGTIVTSAEGGSIKLNPNIPRVLSSGDMIRLGETTLKFMLV